MISLNLRDALPEKDPLAPPKNLESGKTDRGEPARATASNTSRFADSAAQTATSTPNVVTPELAAATAKISPRSYDEPRPDLSMIAERLESGLGNRYDILAPLAIGGMATIFPMQHRLHHGLFVAKVLHPWLAGLPEVLTSFRNEAAHAATLSGHPNIVPAFDVGELDGLLYIVMPYIEGEDLDHLLGRSGPLPRAEALMLAAQINSAVVFAESRGILHGDLTPGNIRLDVFGTYRLMDFGLSTTVGSPARNWHRGTPLYTSPEHLRGEALDVRSDLYALGVILFEALVGHPPFQAPTLNELEQKHLQGTWTMPPSLESDRGIAHLLRVLLATERRDRMEHPAILAGALVALGCALPSDRDRPRLEVANLLVRTAPRRRLTVADEPPG